MALSEAQQTCLLGELSLLGTQKRTINDRIAEVCERLNVNLRSLNRSINDSLIHVHEVHTQNYVNAPVAPAGAPPIGGVLPPIVVNEYTENYKKKFSYYIGTATTSPSTKPRECDDPDKWEICNAYFRRYLVATEENKDILYVCQNILNNIEKARKLQELLRDSNYVTAPNHYNEDQLFVVKVIAGKITER